MTAGASGRASCSHTAEEMAALISCKVHNHTQRLIKEQMNRGADQKRPDLYVWVEFNVKVRKELSSRAKNQTDLYGTKC